MRQMAPQCLHSLMSVVGAVFNNSVNDVNLQLADCNSNFVNGIAAQIF